LLSFLPFSLSAFCRSAPFNFIAKWLGRPAAGLRKALSTFFNVFSARKTRQVAAKCCSSSVEQNPKVEENVFVQILLDEFVILFGVFDSGRQMVSRGQLRSYALALPSCPHI